MINNLLFLLEHFYRMTEIPIRCVDSSGKIVIFNQGYQQNNDPFNRKKVKEKIIDKMSNKQASIIELNDYMHFYGCLKDDKNYLIVIGPITIYKQTEAQMKKSAKKLEIDYEKFFISNKGLKEVSSILTLLHFTCHQTLLDNSKLFSDTAGHQIAYQKSLYTLNNTDEETSRHGYEYERNFLEMIKAGNVNAFEQKVIAFRTEAQIGKLAHNSKKHFEYMICTSIALATRAAIEGGLDPTTAYFTSDMFLQRLEQCTTISEIMNLHSEMALFFAKQVQITQKYRSNIAYVEKCKLYISQHLNRPFTLDDIATYINVNKYHLSRKFTQEEGMSIMKYTLTQRIKTATNMLKYSDKKISDIALFLAFPDQSHFGKVFKSVVGLTPKQYRLSNQVVELRKNTQK